MLRPLGWAAALLITAGCGSGGGSSKLVATAYRSPTSLPASSWTDEQGRPLTLAPGRTTVIYFGYTGCPDTCPLVMADTAVAMRALPPSTRAKVDVYMITSDPKRDTPPVLKEWVTGFDADFHGLTGSWSQIYAAAAGVGVPLPIAEPQDVSEVGHGSQIIVYGPSGLAVGYWKPSQQPDHLAKDIEHDLPLIEAGRRT